MYIWRNPRSGVVLEGKEIAWYFFRGTPEGEDAPVVGIGTEDEKEREWYIDLQPDEIRKLLTLILEDRTYFLFAAKLVQALCVEGKSTVKSVRTIAIPDRIRYVTGEAGQGPSRPYEAHPITAVKDLIELIPNPLADDENLKR